MLEPQAHAECLEFVRAAIASGNPEFVSQIATIVRDCCQRGYTNKQQILDDLTPTEQKQWKLWFARFVR